MLKIRNGVFETNSSAEDIYMNMVGGWADENITKQKCRLELRLEKLINGDDIDENEINHLIKNDKFVVQSNFYAKFEETLVEYLTQYWHLFGTDYLVSAYFTSSQYRKIWFEENPNVRWEKPFLSFDIWVKRAKTEDGIVYALEFDDYDKYQELLNKITAVFRLELDFNFCVDSIRLVCKGE